MENISAAKEFYDTALSSLKDGLIKEVKTLFADDHMAQFGMASLSSVIKDWCEALDSTVFEHLFPDGTEKCLALFQTITNDEDMFIARLAKLATGLRLEDWDDNTHVRFIKNLKGYKENAEQYHSKAEDRTSSNSDSNYQVTFVDENGSTSIRRFDRVEVSKRGKLLLNAIISDMESMGRSVSEQEKRQILMEVLKKNVLKEVKQIWPTLIMLQLRFQSRNVYTHSWIISIEIMVQA